MNRMTRLAALAAGAAVLVVPAAAQAGTTTVSAGPPLTKPPKGVSQTASPNHFYPNNVKVAVGSKIAFKFFGFHVVYFPKGTSSPPFALPDTSSPITGANDAAGNAFWFNGQPNVNVNPEVGLPVGKKVVNGSSAVGSGLPQGEKVPPFVVKFPKAGKFVYFCPIHPGMKGTVTVVKNKKAADSSAKVKSAVAKQLAKDLKRVKSLQNGPTLAANTVQAGNDTADGLSFIQFFPKTLSVKVGQPVTLQMSSHSSEIHTFTFGPTDYLKPLVDGFIAPVGGTSGPPTLRINPIAGYPSDPPTAPASYSSTSHGNGFWNSGVLDTLPATPQQNKTQVTFTAPGTYHYICLVHGPEMSGDITVTQ